MGWFRRACLAACRGVAGHDPSPVRRLLELLAVTAAAVAQPVLDVFSKSADVFVLRGAGPLEVVVFACLLAFGPPLAAWLVELLVARVSRRAAQVVHLLVLSTFASLIVIQVLKELTDQGWRRILAASLVAGPVLVVAVVGVAALRTWLRLLAVFPFVLVALFLFTSPVSDVVFEDGVAVADVAVGRPAPVVAIVLDELPTGSLLDAEGRIDASLFPNFAALAEGSTWYRNHTTVAAATLQAVPAIVTGQWPPQTDVVPTTTNYPDNLFTLLGRSYEVHAHEATTELCPSELCADGPGGALEELLGDAADVWTSQVSPKPTKRALDFDVAGAQGGDAARASQVEDFVADLAPSSSRPRLDYVHALLPHGAWNFLPSGARYVGPHPPTGNVFYHWATEFAGAAGRQRHLLQVQYTDRLLGAVLDRLRALGTYEESLIVVTADHGVAFGPGDPLREATPETYPEIMWAPLFIKPPGPARPAVVETPARSIDVLPTIADLLDVDVPWDLDGRSLLTPGRPGDDVRVLDTSLARGGERDGEYLLFDGAEGYREVLASGGLVGDDPLAVYRIEPFGALVGADVRSLQVEPGRGPRARLDDPRALADVDLEAEVLPVYVTGEVTVEDPVNVAVAIDGVIAGWCQTTDQVGIPNERGTEDYPFWVVVPEALLRPGRNEVELYELRAGEDGAPRLRRMELG